MKNIFFVALIVFFSQQLAAQDISFDASTIPEKIRTGANTVKRLEEVSFEISDLDRTRYKVHKVYTILNKEGDRNLFFYEYTNRNSSLSDVEIKIFNAAGKEVNRFKKKDLIKEARNAELVEDGMYHYIQLSIPSYPATIEYTYQITYSGTFNYPDWQVQSVDEGVERASMTVRTPRDLGLRFKNQATEIKPEITNDGTDIIYKWTANNLTPFKYEKGSVSEGSFCPSVLLAPNKFRIYNTDGDMSSWKSFGEWEQNLLKDLEVLSDERKQFFSGLVKDAKTDKEKIAIVYHYLQENFRYVSIQLGIGGYKPFPAKFTDEKKYGDCKGLSFYMHSVLHSLGIKSYVALINAEYNKPPVDPSFSTNGFNHMILCVPQVKDTIWLECTSKTNEFNFLGSFTENRYALLITENGGVLVPTPRSVPADNLMNVSTYIELKEDGSGTTKSEIMTKGLYNEILREVETSKKEDQKEYIVNMFGFKQPDEFSITKREKGKENTEILLDIEKIPQFTAGTKMFLNPRIYSLLSSKMPESENRKHDYYFKSCFDKSDTTVYHLPDGYLADVLPKNIQRDCPYASYTANFSYNSAKNELVTYARLVLKQNRIPAEKYGEVKTFFDQIFSDDNQKLVIKKN